MLLQLHSFPREEGVPGNWTVSPTPAPTALPLPAEPSQTSGPIIAGPAYALQVTMPGGVPAPVPDVPVSGALLVLFLATGASHMLVLQSNRRRGLIFVFSGMMFALCLLRSAALSMRIVWTFYPHTAAIAIAAGVLTQTGSVLIFILNLILSQRIVRGYHPRFGWHRATNAAFRLLLGCVVATLVMVMAVTIQTFFTRDPATRNIDRAVQLVSGTMMAGLAFVPIPIVLVAACTPRRYRIEKFGAGRWCTKQRLVMFTSFVATLGAVYRVGTAYLPRSVDDSAWYHSLPCYYCFNFATDLIITATYLITRFDRRFVVPNGAKGPGDYEKGLWEPEPSSHTDTFDGDGGDDTGGGGDTDDEKLSTSTDKCVESDEKSGMGTGPPRIPSLLYERDKGKSKEVDDDADKETMGDVQEVGGLSRRLSVELYKNTGKWEGLPWPPPVPWWVSPRQAQSTDTRVPGASSSQPSGSGGESESPGAEQCPPNGVDTVSNSQASTECGGDSDTSATYAQVQETEAARLVSGAHPEHHFHQHQLTEWPAAQGQQSWGSSSSNGSPPASGNSNSNSEERDSISLKSQHSPGPRAGDTPWPFTSPMSASSSRRSHNTFFGHPHNPRRACHLNQGLFRAPIDSYMGLDLDSDHRNSDGGCSGDARSRSPSLSRTDHSRTSSHRTASRSRSRSSGGPPSAGLSNESESVLDNENEI